MSSVAIPGEYNWYENMDVRDKARLGRLDHDDKFMVYHIIDKAVEAAVRFERSKMDVTNMWKHIYTLENRVKELEKEADETNENDR
jgi:hypothetical protein